MARIHTKDQVAEQPAVQLSGLRCLMMSATNLRITRDLLLPQLLSGHINLAT